MEHPSICLISMAMKEIHVSINVKIPHQQKKAVHDTLEAKAPHFIVISNIAISATFTAALVIKDS